MLSQRKFTFKQISKIRDAAQRAFSTYRDATVQLFTPHGFGAVEMAFARVGRSVTPGSVFALAIHVATAGPGLSTLRFRFRRATRSLIIHDTHL